MAEQWDGLAKRLEAKFGTGDAVVLSKRVYRRCEVLCRKNGAECYELVKEVAAAAAFANAPGKWFRASILRAMVEEGFLRELRPRTAAGARLASHLSSTIGNMPEDKVDGSSALPRERKASNV